jgi:hypothetical protein
MFHLRALRVLRGENAVSFKRQTYNEEHEGHEEIQISGTYTYKQLAYI